MKNFSPYFSLTPLNGVFKRTTQVNTRPSVDLQPALFGSLRSPT